MSQWDYKGHTITMDGAIFVATVGEKKIRASSLDAARKAIGKQLEVKAQEVEMNLPVLLVHSRRYSEKRVVTESAITGIDPDTLRVKGFPEEASRSLQDVLPYSASNAKLVADYDEAERVFFDLQSKVKARSVETYFGGYGRSKVLYGEAVLRLQESYDKAKRAK